jgi:hypothetical protein
MIRYEGQALEEIVDIEEVVGSIPLVATEWGPITPAYGLVNGGALQLA